MREATQAEYYAAFLRANPPETQRAATKRTYSEWHKDRGTPVAEMHQILTRGKVSSVSYMVNPDYLKPRSER